MSICRALHEADPEMKIVAASASILDPVMEELRRNSAASIPCQNLTPWTVSIMSWQPCRFEMTGRTALMRPEGCSGKLADGLPVLFEFFCRNRNPGLDLR